MRNRFQHVLLIFSLCVLMCVGGVVRYNTHVVVIPENQFDQKAGSTIEFSTIINTEPLDKGSYVQYVVKPQNSSQKFLIKASAYPVFEYGDGVTFKGKLELPKNIENQNGKNFDYVAYLQKDDIHYILSFAQGTLISHGNGNLVQSGLFKIKNSFLRNINTSILEPESSLMAGILLGVDTLSKELEEKFRSTGIVHIVVLSGYNITIVAESLVRFFSFLPKSTALGFGAFGILLFSLMVGGTPSVLRASLMALLVLLAKATGRKYNIGRALLVAAFSMVLWNPSILVFDVSFQLSFLSTVALIWISPFFVKWLSWIPEKWGMREVTAATLSTQLFVLPLLLYKMGQFSLVGLPVNLLVLGLVPTLMFFGFITGLCGFVSPTLSLPFGFVSYWMLKYIFVVVDLFSRLPFASIHIERFSVWMFWISYGVYGFLFWKLQNKRARIHVPYV